MTCAKALKTARSQAMINLVAAFIHEARPLIEHHRLFPLKGKHPYPLYENDQFMLVLSGMGKLASAAATAYLQGLTLNRGAVAWLNFGLAGHQSFEVGQGFIAHRILDQGSEQCYYPPRIFPFPCPTSDLITVEKPERRYEMPSGYDMEASGFFKTALRTSTLELIHSYKVVSDNPQHPIEVDTKASVIRLMSSRIEEMNAVLSILLKAVSDYRKTYASSDNLDRILEKWHFTATQQAQLTALLKRWQALHRKGPLSSLHLEDYSQARAFLADLLRRLDAHQLVIETSSD